MTRETLIELTAKDYIRFRKKVGEADSAGCMNWTGSTNENGYGTFHLGGGPRKAHRFAFRIRHGYWPRPMCLHSCHNRLCVNPEHLRSGSHMDNMNDRDASGRTSRTFGNANGRTKIRDERLPSLFDLRKQGLTCKEISKIVGISWQQVYGITTGLSRRNSAQLQNQQKS
jgi:hypothetical protein